MKVIARLRKRGAQILLLSFLVTCVGVLPAKATGPEDCAAICELMALICALEGGRLDGHCVYYIDTDICEPWGCLLIN